MHDRYIGLGVHRAARICSAGHGGQILLSGATFAVLADDVEPDIGFVDLGEHRLRNLDRSERIYQLVIPDLPRVFPPLKAVPVAESGTGAVASARTFPTVDNRMLRIVVADDSVLIRGGL
jgi:hypothetical protein